MMGKKCLLVLGFVILQYSLLCAQTVLQPWYVIDRGGGTSAEDSLMLQASVGQPAIQAMTSSGSGLEPGYLPGVRGFENPTETVIEGMNHGWNLISLPIITTDSSQADLYPGSISKVFEYNGSYIPVPGIENGIGYWVKFASDTSLGLSGMPFQQESLAVGARWNLIGSLSVAVPVSSIGSDSSGVVLSSVFGYLGGYFKEDTIRPGKGYWIKSNKSCRLILSAAGGAAGGNMPRIISTGEYPPDPPGEASIPAPVPAAYVLHHSYPDPFNPSATIRYELPVTSIVAIKVYNLLGQVVGILREGMEDPGYWSVVWDASGFASGVYFYRFEARSVTDPEVRFSKVGKMILAR